MCNAATNKISQMPVVFVELFVTDTPVVLKFFFFYSCNEEMDWLIAGPILFLLFVSLFTLDAVKCESKT